MNCMNKKKEGISLFSNDSPESNESRNFISFFSSYKFS